MHEERDASGGFSKDDVSPDLRRGREPLDDRHVDGFCTPLTCAAVWQEPTRGRASWRGDDAGLPPCANGESGLASGGLGNKGAAR
mmetsp:Transcript_55121/g.141961  ORF Transcript_55121/g.141961 Transcript_55121/m.141961 type:complete len:85 (-) Transcript_55121:104-358(-)